jgi:hypothetical protein
LFARVRRTFVLLAVLPYSTQKMARQEGPLGDGERMARVRGKAAASGIWAGLAVSLGLLVSGCGPHSSASGSSTTPPGTSSSATSTATTAKAAGPVVGPGPQATYHVQSQPAPHSCHFVVVISAAAGDYLPDPHCTPGATNPRVTQANLASTICRSGYTASIRPPASITGREKRASEAAYGFTGNAKTTEYDHLISLELGGDPNSPLNLWPEPNRTGATGVNNPKDRVENTLNTLVCNAVHRKAYLPLVKAQYLIATNWTTAIATAQTELVG